MIEAVFNGRLAGVMGHIERYLPPTVLDPWKKRGIDAQPFGPVNSIHKSSEVAKHASGLIKEIQVGTHPPTEGSKTYWENDWAHKDESAIAESKDLQIAQLEKEWRQIPKGGIEELRWTQKAIALTSAYFEHLMETKGKPVKLRDNQALYILELVLDKGKGYPIGELETNNRFVELPTGEGKTYAFALAAATTALKGEQIHIIEPNYNSAIDHAEQTGEFFLRFLNSPVGVVVDTPEKEGRTSKTIMDRVGLAKQVIIDRNTRESYLYTYGPKRSIVAISQPELQPQLIKQAGNLGRQDAWKQRIVIADTNSLGLDFVEDNQPFPEFTPDSPNKQPKLGERVGFVAEADSVMLDGASTQWKISEALQGDKALDHLITECDLDSLPGVYDLPADAKRQLMSNILLGMWNVLEVNKGGFREGVDADYIVSRGQLMMSPDAYDDAFELLRQSMQPEDQNVAREWLDNNSRIVYSVLRTFFAIKPQTDIIYSPIPNIQGGGENAVFLDENGFPLQKRQLEGVEQAFLHFKANWATWRQEAIDELTKQRQSGLEEVVRGKKQAGTEEERHKLRETTGDLNNATKITEEHILDMITRRHLKDMRASTDVDRAVPSVLFNAYKYTRNSSGSLIPVAQSLYDIYKAETFKVGRHMPFPTPEGPAAIPNSFRIKCLDGGYADAIFVPGNDAIALAQQRAQELIQSGRTGLIIASSIEEAEAIAAGITESKLITGKDELVQSGGLVRIIREGQIPIVVTTGIAARDIDMANVSEDVQRKGGPEVIGVGLPSSERNLWQLLQRTGRGDLPGSRLLIIGENHLRPLINDRLFQKSSMNLVKYNRKKLERFLKGALSGNTGSQHKLFEECLKYLRSTEEARKEGLLAIEARDGRLPEIKKRFKEMCTIKRIDLPQIREMWTQFLAELDNEFNAFPLVIQSQRSSLPPGAIRTAWYNHVRGRLQEVEKSL